MNEADAGTARRYGRDSFLMDWRGGPIRMVL